uniref:guanylate kinase n=2 Tax=Muribaculaceae TaxID=2005473 RepID=UPI002715028D
QPRGEEVHGVNYYFLSDDEFRSAIAQDAFVEYEEVYPGRFYGTLKSEVERITAEGHNVILDIDVKGGLNVKKLYGEDALSIFIQPPGLEVLRQRLTSRATDSAEAIEQRLAKAEYELSFAPEFDRVVVNDSLDRAVAEVDTVIKNFLSVCVEEC